MVLNLAFLNEQEAKNFSFTKSHYSNAKGSKGGNTLN